MNKSTTKTCSNCAHSTPLANAGWNHKNSNGLLEYGINGFKNANGVIDNFDWVHPNQTCGKHKPACNNKV